MTRLERMVEDADRAACNAAPGPWRAQDTDVIDARGARVAQAESYPDALAIVAAFNLVAEAQLHAEVRRELEQGAEAAREHLGNLEDRVSDAEAELSSAEHELDAAKEELEKVKAEISDAKAKLTGRR